MIPYVTGTCHIIIGKDNSGDTSSFHLLSFLSFGFSVSTTTKAIPLALGGSSLVDSLATSPLVEEGKRRRSYRWLCSRKDDGDLGGELVAIRRRLKRCRYMSGSRRTIQVQDEDKRRLLLRLMKRQEVDGLRRVIQVRPKAYSC
ncbi:hypothetical protein F2Q69_00055004 [Brassica cretica]|uniref:Uncharacterized protein n=1 Tax=Brassica cretica TaxID=69181 RepID=A0A8S9MMX0_BRACR|nr:hypothetical protein F2Q69_00055004 [Brassica cretica]